MSPPEWLRELAECTLESLIILLVCNDSFVSVSCRLQLTCLQSACVAQNSVQVFDACALCVIKLHPGRRLHMTLHWVSHIYILIFSSATGPGIRTHQYSSYSRHSFKL